MGLKAARRLWWVWASWAVFSAVALWHWTQAERLEEVAGLLRENVRRERKLCDAEHRLADLAERMCLPCEGIQSEWLAVLGAPPRTRARRHRLGVAAGPVGGPSLDEKQK